MKLQFLISLLLVLIGCYKKENANVNITNLNCPIYYPKIENIYWADYGFEEPQDNQNQYWYRLITFSEEEGFCMIIEKLRQGVAEGMGKMEVVEQRDLTHLRGIDDANGISVRYRVNGWMNNKEIVLEVDENETHKKNRMYKVVNVESLHVKDSVVK